jgi:hypothetical protein
MYTSKHIFFVMVVMTGMFINHCFAQSIVKTDSLVQRKQSFVLQVGGGLNYYLAAVKIKPAALAGSVNRYSAAGTVRLMWYPRYRLRIGLETGYTNFYSYKVINGNTKGKLSLEAIPVLVVWSMQLVRRVNVYAGIGSYLLTTRLNYDGKVNSSAWVLGTNIALSYTQPLSKKIGIAAEAKWMNSFETKDAAISIQAQLVWKFLQW